mmetsp:Transcript_29130/g.64384  ORF Transcript_29130/g.64384 Transcript_29130/m.64384 type:complete len:232 (+) Transcript_29130:1992-2687(+)
MQRTCQRQPCEHRAKDCQVEEVPQSPPLEVQGLSAVPHSADQEHHQHDQHRQAHRGVLQVLEQRGHQRHCRGHAPCQQALHLPQAQRTIHQGAVITIRGIICADVVVPDGVDHVAEDEEGETTQCGHEEGGHVQRGCGGRGQQGSNQHEGLQGDKERPGACCRHIVKHTNRIGGAGQCGSGAAGSTSPLLAAAGAASSTSPLLDAAGAAGSISLLQGRHQHKLDCLHTNTW